MKVTIDIDFKVDEFEKVRKIYSDEYIFYRGMMDLAPFISNFSVPDGFPIIGEVKNG